MRPLLLGTAVTLLLACERPQRAAPVVDASPPPVVDASTIPSPGGDAAISPTEGTAADAAKPAAARIPCGKTTCGAGEYCCIKSCSMCAPIGAACPAMECGDGDPSKLLR